MTGPGASRRHTVRIRYVDCDMQGVVYNAHYLTFVDDGFDCWLRELDPSFETARGWEVMLKKAEITWESPARFGENLDIDLRVSRWGTTSFDVEYAGSVGARAAFAARVTYVVVDHAGLHPVPVPGELRRHLDA